MVSAVSQFPGSRSRLSCWCRMPAGDAAGQQERLRRPSRWSGGKAARPVTRATGARCEAGCRAMTGSAGGGRASSSAGPVSAPVTCGVVGADLRSPTLMLRVVAEGRRRHVLGVQVVEGEGGDDLAHGGAEVRGRGTGGLARRSPVWVVRFTRYLSPKTSLDSGRFAVPERGPAAPSARSRREMGSELPSSPYGRRSGAGLVAVRFSRGSGTEARREGWPSTARPASGPSRSSVMPRRLDRPGGNPRRQQGQCCLCRGSRVCRLRA